MDVVSFMAADAAIGAVSPEADIEMLGESCAEAEFVSGNENRYSLPGARHGAKRAPSLCSAAIVWLMPRTTVKVLPATCVTRRSSLSTRTKLPMPMFAASASATPICVTVDDIAVVRVVGVLIDKISVPLLRVQSATRPKYAFGNEVKV